MDAYDEWKDSDDESEHEDDAPSFIFKPSYILIAIDTHSTMFTTNGSNRSPFMECLDACYQAANALVMADRSSIKGPLGIMLAENETARATFVEFEQSVPETIQVLKDLAKQPNQDLKAKYQRKGDFDLADFFLLCKNKLLKINADVYKRTVIYITNDDDPVQNDPRKRFKIVNESQKFPDIQMDLNVVTFKPDFDYDNFYAELLKASQSPPVEQVQSTVSLTDKLTSLIQVRYKKYRYKLYPFKGDRTSYIEVIINNFIQSGNIVKNMYVTRDTQKEVKKAINQQEYTGDYRCIYAKDQEPLMFNEIEKEQLLETDLPVGYSLLCVGDETAKDGWIIKPPTLMEKHHKETDLVFDAFWQFCKDKSKCLVCLQKYKKGGDVRLVELVPRFVNNTRMFLLRFLPFGPEINLPQLPKQEVKFADEEVEAMSALVDELSFDYHPSKFTDPVMGKKKAYIKSQLLEEPMEKFDDGFPSDEHLDERIAAEMKELKVLGLVELAAGDKRAAVQKSRGGRKKLKAEPK